MIYFYLSGIFFFFSLLSLMVSLIFMILKKSFFCEWNFFSFESINFNFVFFFDWMSFMFSFVVLIISSMIMFYSSEYMNTDVNKVRFFFLLFFFVLSMLMLIFSTNLLSMLIGWDGLGLISYCLIIYYPDKNSEVSGMLTFLINRMGDVFILISLGLIIVKGSFDYLNLNFLNDLILVFFIILASFTKSAQFPFSSWLPAAMAAPTPVSSLVHSSTLVTAGIYFLIRFHYLFLNNENFMFYIMLTGLLTMVMAGASANLEFDLKKIIAFSTLSQLGLMMMILGMKNYELSFMHLIIHAMFKSMMFMSAGIIIHSMFGVQDIRFMGMLGKFMPLTMSMFMIANFSLCGMPFFSGFYSKDQILETMMMMKNNLFIYLLMLLGTGLTVMYSLRLSFFLMGKVFNFFPLNMLIDNKVMNFSMIILMIMTIFFGNMFNWLMFSMIEEIYLMFFEKILILLICSSFYLISMMIKQYNNYKKFYYMKMFFGKMCFLYEMNSLIIKYPLFLGSLYMSVVDKGWSEWIFKDSLFNSSNKVKYFILLINNNYLISLMMCFSYFLILILML